MSTAKVVRYLHVVKKHRTQTAAIDPQQSAAAIGERLRLTRDVSGLGQAEFAARANLAANTYNQIEHGKKRPSIEVAIALCVAYELTLDWVYRGDPSGLRYETADAIKALRQARR
jgi:transcriptional regulator with XRE-family HTH domain